MTLRISFAVLLAAVAATATPAFAVDPPPAVAPAAATAWIPPDHIARTKVYILDGLNPLEMAGTWQLADRLQRAGFPYTKAGGWFMGWWYEREIRAAYAADPTARFAIVGYSAGSYVARGMANRLLRDGIPVAVVGYIGGDYLQDTPATRVPGAGRVVNIRGDGYLLTGKNLLFNGTDLTGARNIRTPGVAHYGLPTHPTTFAVLYSALAAEDGE